LVVSWASTLTVLAAPPTLLAAVVPLGAEAAGAVPDVAGLAAVVPAGRAVAFAVVEAAAVVGGGGGGVGLATAAGAVVAVSDVLLPPQAVSIGKATTPSSPARFRISRRLIGQAT